MFEYPFNYCSEISQGGIIFSLVKKALMCAQNVHLWEMTLRLCQAETHSGHIPAWTYCCMSGQDVRPKRKELGSHQPFHNLSLMRFLPFQQEVRQAMEVTPSNKYKG